MGTLSIASTENQHVVIKLYESFLIYLEQINKVLINLVNKSILIRLENLLSSD